MEVSRSSPDSTASGGVTSESRAAPAVGIAQSVDIGQFVGITLLVVIALLAGIGLAVGTGVAAADATGSATDGSAAALDAPTAVASDPCAGVQRPAIVATLPEGGSYGPNQTLSVYRGTEVVVHACADGGVVLDASDVAGLTVRSASHDRLHLRVDGPIPDRRLDLGSLASSGSSETDSPSGTVPAAILTTAGGAVDTELVDGPLATHSPDRADEIERAEATLRDREHRVHDGLDALDTATAAVETGDRVDGSAFEVLYDAHEQYRVAVATLRELLYEVAASEAGSARTVAAIDALEAEEDALAQATTDAATDYEAAIGERDRSYTWDLRLRVLGLGLLGLLVGCALGAALPVRRGRVARRQLREGEWATYARAVVRIPVLVGAVLLLAGLGWLALRAGWVLLEVVV